MPARSRGCRWARVGVETLRRQAVVAAPAVALPTLVAVGEALVAGQALQAGARLAVAQEVLARWAHTAEAARAVDTAVGARSGYSLALVNVCHHNAATRGQYSGGWVGRIEWVELTE